MKNIWIASTTTIPKAKGKRGKQGVEGKEFVRRAIYISTYFGRESLIYEQLINIRSVA